VIAPGSVAETEFQSINNHNNDELEAPRMTMIWMMMVMGALRRRRWQQ
jgi:hypothetical protein